MTCTACGHAHPDGICHARVRELECICLREHHDEPLPETEDDR